MTAKYNAKPDPTKRTPGAPLSEDEKARIRQLITEGKTHRQICDELGIGTSTLSRFKKIEGLQTPVLHDNSAGTQAFKRDAAAKRAYRLGAKDELFKARAEYLLAVMRGERKYKTFQKIGGGAETVVELDWIPAQDWRSETSALGTLDTSINRNDDRADDGGLARAHSMLDTVMRVVAGAVIDVPAEEGQFEE